MKLTIALASLAILFCSSFGRAEMVTRTRTVVDTVAAMDMIKNKIEAKNQPYKLKIQTIESDIKHLEAKIKVNNDSIKKLEYLRESLAPKIKDRDLVAEIANYIGWSMVKMPDDSIFAYCKEKDLKKAKGSDAPVFALDALKSKTRENILKKAYKGDFSSGFAKGCLDYINNMTRYESTHLEFKKNQLEKTRKAEASAITSVPTYFTADLWLNEMPNRDVPTKVITEQRQRRDADDLSYQELVGKYYNKTGLNNKVAPEMADCYLVIEGKFNGIINDRLCIFPIDGRKEEISDDYYYDLFKKVKIVSEKGTVPELIINASKELGETGFYISHGPDYALTNFAIENLKDIWDISGNIIQQDGLILSLHPEGSTIGSLYTYLFENGRWVNKAPLNPDYLSFDDCYKLLNEKGEHIEPIRFNYKVLDEYEDESTYYGEPESVNLLPLNRKKIGLSKDGDSKIYIKSKSINKVGNESTGKEEFFSLDDLVLDGNNFFNIAVEKDYWSKGDDALIVIYNDVENDTIKELEIYRISWSGPDYDYLNGIGIDISCCWEKRLEGVLNTKTGEQKLYKVKKYTEF